jgi:hypothetical protein
MHIHRPKPLHGWREIATEIGVIVVGILIAVTAEQTLEAVHWSHRTEQAEHAMRIELATDDGPQAFARAAIFSCLDARLDAITAAIDQGRDRSEIMRLARAYDPPIRTWDSSAWQSTVASDVGAHFRAERLSGWQRAYNPMPVLAAQSLQEAAALDQLTAFPDEPGSLSEMQGDELRATVRTLRGTNLRIFGLSALVLEGLASVHVEIAEAQKAQILGEARARFGACVETPDTKRLSALIAAGADQLFGMNDLPSILKARPRGR